MFASLSPDERNSLLAKLTNEEIAALAHQWRGWIARPDQLPPPGQWRFWLILAGRGWGKTRVGAEWTREQTKTFQYVNLIAPTAADARDVMVNGESGILAICPPSERPEYFPSKRQLKWPNGAVSTLFSGEDPESLRGPQHERLWADEIAAWAYPQETWDMALLGLRLGNDPRACITSTPKPIRLIKELIADPNCVVTKGTTYDNLENLAPTFAEQIIARYEGTRLGRQEIHAEVLADEGLAYPDFKERLHVVRAFPVPNEWDRFEHMDFGINNPTAWHLHAVDYDGNEIVCGEYYSPGLVSQHAAAIKALRVQGWERKDVDGWTEHNAVYGDPSIRARTGTETKIGDPASILTEFSEHGIGISLGNNDRAAGYARISELLRPDPNRRFPNWHPLAGESGAPRLYVFDTCPNLIQQLLEAPIEEPEKPLAGEAIAGAWESAHGHAHASLRYGVMARARPTKEPEPSFDDPRHEAINRMLKRRHDHVLKPQSAYGDLLS